MPLSKNGKIVSVKVKNIGKVTGKVVQLYIRI
jgi:hypothetical protein